jgi:hypothetical protein
VNARTVPAPPAGRQGWPWEPSGAGAEKPIPDTAAWPRVTVVTPSFNQAPFLEETIRSVLYQQYPNLEYVIIDGGSTDGSVDVIRKYADWLEYWVSEPDNGQAAAIDKGFEHGHGEILAWLNSDDVFEAGALFRAAAVFQRHPEAVLVYGDADQIGRDGTRLGRAPQVVACDKQYLLTDNNAIVQPAAFFRRAAYEAAKGLDHNLYWAMDHDLWLRLADLGSLTYLPETLARTRIYDDAKSSSTSLAMFDEIKAVAERHGGAGLPKQMAAWMAGIKAPEAFAALRRGDAASGSAGLNYVLANAPGWFSEASLAEALAGEAWRRIRDINADSPAALQWAAQICRQLPKSPLDPRQVERRVLGLLYEALAFESFRCGQTAKTLRYVIRAMTQDSRRTANRGLWSIAIRSLVKV